MLLDGSGPLADETVFIGAHYDHVGRGGRVIRPAHQRLHHGADDNASGTGPCRAGPGVSWPCKNPRGAGVGGFTARVCADGLRPLYKDRVSLSQTIAMITWTWSAG